MQSIKLGDCQQVGVLPAEHLMLIPLAKMDELVVALQWRGGMSLQILPL